MTRSSSRAQKVVASGAAAAVAVGGSALLLGAGTGAASSHREAPLIINDPTADNTDVYAFVSPDEPDMVNLIANWYPNQIPDGGPNFYPWATDDQARYTIKIDSDGDAVADTTYRWEFQTQDLRGTVDYGDAPDGTFLYNNGPVTSLDDENLLFRQTYTLLEIDSAGVETVLLADAPVAPSHVGAASMPDYGALRDEATVPLTGEPGQSYVGQADDPFFLDLRIFDLLYGSDLSERGFDTLSGLNVNSVALQVPIDDLTIGDDPVIGVWSTTERRSTRVQADGTQTYSGDWVQISRLGNPLVNEVVIPANLKDAFNSLDPVNDASVQPAVDKVLAPEVPILLNAIYGLPIPETPRDDLFTIYLTGLEGLNKPAGAGQPSELLRLNTSIPPVSSPNPLGVLAGDNAGFPNGRRLTDDVVDISLQAVAGAVTVDERGGMATGVDIVEPLAEGDKVGENDKEFGSTFPYLALPHFGIGDAPPASRAINNSCPADTITEDGFTDVPQSSAFEFAVDCVFQYGIANGTSATTYSPRDSVTREQMAGFISRLITRSGGTLAPQTEDYFTDDNNSSFEDDINRLAEAGIVRGGSDGNYNPRDVVSRAQMAAFLVRAYDYRAAQGGLDRLPSGQNFFPDDDGFSGLESDINKAAAAGFTGGHVDGTYRPAEPVRRDHMAAFLARVLDLVVMNGLSEVPASR
jgi:hypothetical protein